MSLGILDDNNLGVALRLQLEELEQLRGGRKGKHRIGEAPDFDIAADLYKAELSSYAALVSDRAMCKSIARAVNRDAELIRDALQADEQVRRDREIALRLSAGGESKERTPFAPAQPSSPAEDEALINKLEALYMFDEDDTQPESSSWAASRPRTKATKAPLVACTCCGDAYATHDVARCPCSHEYCRECLETLFKNSLVDESLFPPRCCHQPIPLEDNRAFLSARLVGEFQAKRVELETVNRTYCHRPACSTFVPIQFIRDDVATCVRCRTKTCTICKGAGHQGDCPQDTGTQELLRVAEENGWKRCYACRRLVELDHGCNHMSKSFLSAHVFFAVLPKESKNVKLTRKYLLDSLSLWCPILLCLRRALENLPVRPVGRTTPCDPRQRPRGPKPWRPARRPAEGKSSGEREAQPGAEPRVRARRVEVTAGPPSLRGVSRCDAHVHL